MPVVKKKCIHCRTAKLYSYISSTRLWSSIWHHPKILVRPKDWAGDTPQTVSKLYCKFGSHNHYIPCLAHCNDLLLYDSECLIFFFSSVEWLIAMPFLHSYHFFSINFCASLEKFPQETARNSRHLSFVGAPSVQLLECIGQALPLPVHFMTYRLWWHRSKPLAGLLFRMWHMYITTFQFYLIYSYFWLFVFFMGISSLYRFFWRGWGWSKQWDYWKCNFQTGSKLENYRLFACIH